MINKIADIDNIESYYHDLIKEITKKEDKAKADLIYVSNKLSIYKKVLQANYNKLIKIFNIDLNEYDEYTSYSSSTGDRLMSTCVGIAKTNRYKDVDIELIYKLINFTKNVVKLNEIKKNIKLYEKLKTLSVSKYENIIKLYMFKVHKHLLEGSLVRFAHGIGDFLINRIDNKIYASRPTVDYRATNIARKKLIDEGLLPYNKQDAEYYASKRINYNGVPYVIYKTDDRYNYELINILSAIPNRYRFKFYKTDYFPFAYRGKTYNDIYNDIKSKEDIYNLNTDINVKLNMLLRFSPSNYIKFIRNDKQEIYNHRTYIRRDRQ